MAITKNEHLISDNLQISQVKRFSPYILTVIAFFAVYGPTLKWLFDRWMMGVWYNAHGIIVPFISGYMIWSRLKSSDTIKESGSNGFGFVFLVGALLLHIIDTVIWSQILSAISIIPALIGLSFIFIGRSGTLSIWLPLLLLIFMIPIPSAFVQPLVVFLRSATALGAAFLLDLFDIPFIRNGTYIVLPNDVVNVANACSGLSTLMATLGFTVALLWFWPPGFKVSGMLLATALPVAITANIIRTIMLIFLTFYYGSELLDTFLHPLSGYIMYIIAISLQAAVFKLLRKRNSV